MDDALQGTPRNAPEHEALLPVPAVRPTDEAGGAVHLHVVLGLEVGGPPDVVVLGRPGRIRPLVGVELIPPGPDGVLPAFRARRRDVNAVHDYLPAAAAWQTHVRWDRISRVVQRPRLLHGEAAAAKAVRRGDLAGGRG